MRMAQRLDRLGTENAFEILAIVNRLKAEGRDIVSFAIGEPDFDTPGNIKQAGIRAIEKNETHYGPSAGISPLREAIAEYISKTRGISVTPQEVVVTPGAKPIIFYSIMACIDPGDEVIYPNPGFPIYESVIGFVGGVPVPLPLLESKAFSFDIEELRGKISPKTKMIIINSPQNPTGGVLSRSDLEAIAEMAIEHDLWVLSDEIYSRIRYGEEHLSIATIPGMKERTIILEGFSKTYAMTGWRLGYGVMSQPLAEAVAKLETNNESCTATFTQFAGVEALNGPQDGADAMLREFEARRDLIVSGLNEIPGFSCLKPRGAFYVFPNVTEACQMVGAANSRVLMEKILFEANVATLPRSSFGKRNEGENQEYLRFSYATARQGIEEGLGRLQQFMKKYS